MSHAVAIVGAGPSGFYAADGLLRAMPGLRIDLIDRLPTPLGLVRAGVAPDHQGTKAIARQFDRLLDQPGVRFAGNVEIGRDLSWDALRAGYEVFPVVDAVGGTSPEAHRAGLERIVQAGGQPIGWVALACELQRDWARTDTVADVVDIVLTSRLSQGL